MKLSVITINYNDAEGLRRTANSIKNQTSKDFEWIVIDGGSNDGSVDVIKEYEQYIAYWCSEKDSGIYNAMNKGVKKANGLYCNFMNSGDEFADDYVIDSFNKFESDCDVLLGKHRYTPDGVRSNLIQPKMFTASFMVGAAISHQASFIKRELLLLYPYDESLKIVSDWKFFFETLVIKEYSICYLPFYVATQDAFGISGRQKELAKRERNKVLLEYLPNMVVRDLQTFSGCDYENLTYLKSISRNPKINRFAKVLLKAFYNIAMLRNKKNKCCPTKIKELANNS